LTHRQPCEHRRNEGQQIAAEHEVAVPVNLAQETQVWRSVLVWMDLEELKRLYLEGAEDIDRVSGLSAETV
jgi:hypothetical protein